MIIFAKQKSPYFRKYLTPIIWLTFACISQSYACVQIDKSDEPVLVFPPKFDSKNPKQDYVFQLIQLILKKSTNKFGPCEARLLDHKLPLKRLELYLKTNRFIHAAALTVSHERDKQLLPITIPISKGLMGYRLLMIRQGDKNKFANVENLNDLSTFMAGQGIGWADVDILKHNGLPVLTTGSIKTLIDMLAYGRFDYFPRGALQIITEIKAYKEKPIEVEPSILLSYPSMTALYVHSNNINLAQRLEYGLKQAFKDGSFNDFFYAHPSSAQALLNINLKKRKVLKMCNPILPSWVPLDRAEYWLEPWPEKILNNDCEFKKSP